jgi:hypothetical protein
MHVIQVSCHIDEHLPGLDLPLRAAGTVTADLPPGDVRGWLAARYPAAVRAVAAAAGRGARPPAETSLAEPSARIAWALSSAAARAALSA